MWLSVAEQDAGIRAGWPEFRLTMDSGWIGVWEGRLRPISQTYLIRLRYITRQYLDFGVIANPYVAVSVRDPPLGVDPRGTGERIPHIYWNEAAPGFPHLCLYDPAQDEWLPDRPIADTIIPWAISWLAFFECWVLTGEWKGGGRHPVPPEIDTCRPLTSNPQPDDPARRERFRNAAFHSLGRRIGASGSLPLMGAGSGGYSPLPFWPDWNKGLREALRLQGISTSSPEPRPAASSPLALAPVSPLPIFSTST
jgi:hypothetical protein